jgi:hypothetical protein
VPTLRRRLALPQLQEGLISIKTLILQLVQVGLVALYIHLLASGGPIGLKWMLPRIWSFRDNTELANNPSWRLNGKSLHIFAVEGKKFA